MYIAGQLPAIYMNKTKTIYSQHMSSVKIKYKLTFVLSQTENEYMLTIMTGQ